MGKKWPKIAIFQNFIIRPNRPILIICKWGKLSLGIFNPNPVNWTHIYGIGRKIGFFDVKCQKMTFSSTTQNHVCVEISTGVEISTVRFFDKKLMRFFYTPYKYLRDCFITLENIQKVDFAILFRPHGRKWIPGVF